MDGTGDEMEIKFPPTDIPLNCRDDDDDDDDVDDDVITCRFITSFIT